MSSLYHKNRAVLLGEGEDLYPFLQGLLTNDIYQLKSRPAIYTALLSAQGKFMFDFFLFKHGEKIFIDCPAESKEQLKMLFDRYKMRAKVNIQDVSDTYGVYTIHDRESLDPIENDESALVSIDPRYEGLGWRAILKTRAVPPESDLNEYDHLRLSLGIPEAGKDMIPEKAIPLECGLDQLNAISWDKGCYLGQELTARVYYRGELRKRFLPVKILGSMPTSEHPEVKKGDQAVGTLYSRNKDIGIARLRMDEIKEALEGTQPLSCESAELIPYKPDWLHIY